MLTRLLVFLLLGLALAKAQTTTAPIKVGEMVPDVVVRTEDDQEAKLRKLVSGKVTVLIFYRGGWCPYCNRQLQALAAAEDQLVKAGAQILAISMDQPSKLKSTPDREKFRYRLVSDSDATAAKAFGIAFRVDDATVEKYRGYGIDLEAASGRDHQMLPHPSVFVIAPSGEIRFAHVNPDYKVRLEPAKIVEAVQATSR